MIRLNCGLKVKSAITEITFITCVKTDDTTEKRFLTKKG